MYISQISKGNLPYFQCLRLPSPLRLVVFDISLLDQLFLVQAWRAAAVVVATHVAIVGEKMIALSTALLEDCRYSS